MFCVTPERSPIDHLHFMSIIIQVPNGVRKSIICSQLQRHCSVVLSPSEEELRKLREEMNVETLKQELEKERLKRLDLEHKMNEILKTRYEKRICFLCSCSQTV